MRYIDKPAEYKCSCNTKRRVYLGFIWAKYIMIPVNIFLLGIIIYFLIFEVIIQGIIDLPFFLVMLVLIIVEYRRYRSRKKQLLAFGHSKKCSRKCSIIAAFFDIPRVEGFYITGKKLRK